MIKDEEEALHWVEIAEAQFKDTMSRARFMVEVSSRAPEIIGTAAYGAFVNTYAREFLRIVNHHLKDQPR